MKRFVFLAAVLMFTGSLFAGSAFAEARDKDDNTPTWTFFTADKVSPQSAATSAIEQLKKEGQTKVNCPASTPIDHGVYVVIFASYEHKDDIRFRYGYGFHKTSDKEAEKEALRNLKKTDKFFKDEFGYKIRETKKF